MLSKIFGIFSSLLSCSLHGGNTIKYSFRKMVEIPLLQKFATFFVLMGTTILTIAVVTAQLSSPGHNVMVSAVIIFIAVQFI